MPNSPEMWKLGRGILSPPYFTLLFVDTSVDHARNLKWFLSCFENLSGLKINFRKSDLHTINVGGELANCFAQVCQIGSSHLST